MKNHPQTDHQLLAGAAKIDITPVTGTQLAGDIGRNRPAQLVLEPLFAKALVLDDGAKKICFLSLDLLAATREWCDQIKQELAGHYGILPENTIVHVTQNHSAPSLGHLMVTETNQLLPEGPDWDFARGGDDAYHPLVVAKVISLVGQALAGLQPVQLALSRSLDGRFSFNRRVIMRDGTAKTHPRADDPNILYVEGPKDPEVGVCLFINSKLENIAVLLHHSCHPCHGYPHNYVSSDWPGAWCAQMEAELGPACVALVANGFCGNLYHHDYSNPTFPPSDYKKMAAGLTETALKSLKRAIISENTVLACSNRRLTLPMRQLAKERLAAARRTLEEQPLPLWDESKGCIDWDWWYAMSTLDVQQHYQPDFLFTYDIQVVRIGDLGLVCCGGEPFVEGQLQIKQNSPAPFTFTAHMCNYYVGYIPTKLALQNGGYETWTGQASKLAPEALDIICNNALAQLEELFS